MKFDHPLYTLRLTNDNEILVAISQSSIGKISTLKLEENLDSVRLNFPRDIYENKDLNITNDNKYIIFDMGDD